MIANFDGVEFDFNNATVAEGGKHFSHSLTYRRWAKDPFDIVAKLLPPTEDRALLLEDLPLSSVIKICIPISGELTSPSLDVSILLLSILIS